LNMRPTVFLPALKDSLRLYRPFLASSLLLLLILFFGVELLHHYFLTIMRLTQGIQSFNLPAIMGQILTSLLEFVCLTMLVPLKIMALQGRAPDIGFVAFTQKHIKALTLESLRALAVTLIWTMALILPGFFKYLRFFFVPYIVVADPLYEKGQVDALEKSNQLVKGYTLQLFIIICLLTASELTRGAMREKFPLLQEPVAAIGLAVGFFAFSLLTNILLFRIYQLRMESSGRN